MIEITGYTTPCNNNARWFVDGDFSRMSQKLHPGESRVYASVLQGGVLRPGDPITLLAESAAVQTRRAQPRTIRWRPEAL